MKLKETSHGHGNLIKSYSTLVTVSERFLKKSNLFPKIEIKYLAEGTTWY